MRKHHATHAALAALAVLFLASQTVAEAPISLDADNPHYLHFRGRPTVLVTSGEHYGAVLNLDFDYVTYLDTLAADGLNLTRLFSGTYREAPGNFKIERNTLAPAEGRYLCPWARSSVPGYAGGGNKFDLTRFDPAYFVRLKDFCAEASKRGIVVELVLFCPLYQDAMWNLSPMKASNNTAGIGNVPRTECLTLNSPELVAVQEALVRKIVAELADVDNLYYEICNEPYFGGVTLDWQHRIAEVIVQAERDLPHRHLIAQNIANKQAVITDPHPAVSIFNFHYAVPKAVADNFHLNKVLGDDETGFRGPMDATYLDEAWAFLLSGGAIFSHLDYSFTAGWEQGVFPYPSTQPGAGSPTLRRQLGLLKRFLDSFDLVRMTPDRTVRGGIALVEPGRQYAVYRQADAVELDLPQGTYDACWLDVQSGRIARRETLRHAGGPAKLAFPPDASALRLVAPGAGGKLDLGEPASSDLVTLVYPGPRRGLDKSQPIRVYPIGAARVAPSGVLELSGGTVLGDLGSGGRLLDACRASGQLTIEAVFQPADAKQTGPARIVSFSVDTANRNFTLGQDGDQLVLRLRTPQTGPNGVNPQVALAKIEPDRRQTVTITYRDGRLTAWLDGRQVLQTNVVQGDFRNWAPARLVFGNEYTTDRPWRGTIDRVKISSQAQDGP